MDMVFVQEVIVPIIYAIVGVALIWALVELILFLRRTSKTVSAVEEQVQPILADAQKMTEDLKPAVEKLDPLVDRVSLAVDAANLEIMRIDAILEDVSAMTDTAARTVEAVDSVAQTPMRLATEASAKLRATFGSKNASDTAVALGHAAEGTAPAALHDGSADGVVEPQTQEVEPEPVAPVYTAAGPQAQVDAQAQPEAQSEPEAKEATSQSSSKYFTY